LPELQALKVHTETEIANSKAQILSEVKSDYVKELEVLKKRAEEILSRPIEATPKIMSHLEAKLQELLKEAEQGAIVSMNVKYTNEMNKKMKETIEELHNLRDTNEQLHRTAILAMRTAVKRYDDIEHVNIETTKNVRAIEKLEKENKRLIDDIKTIGKEKSEYVGVVEYKEEITNMSKKK